MKLPRGRAELEHLVAKGESVSLEFKRSTGELHDAMRTVCAFMNGRGGFVLFGIRPDGRVEGQSVGDGTLRQVAQQFDRFEPPLTIEPVRMTIASGREVLLLAVEPANDAIPFTYDGRAYERVTSTTRVMPQQTYEELLMARTHSRRRWENMSADIATRDIDREEVMRVARIARDSGRLFGPAGRNAADLLDRMGLRVGGRILVNDGLLEFEVLAVDDQ